MEYARSRPIASLLIGLVGTAVIVSLIEPSLGDTVGVLGVFVGQLGAAVIGLRAARKLPVADRRPWTLIFMTFVFAAVGVLTTGVLSEVFAVNVAAYSPVDLLFLVGYGYLLWGILQLPAAARRGSDRLRIVVDAAVGAIAVSVLAWVWVLDDIAAAFLQADVWQRVLGLAYPVFDIIGIVIVITSFIRKRHEILDVRMILLSIALLFQTIADISFASVAAGQGLAEAQPIFWLFAAASLFYMATAIAVGRPLRQRHTAERSPSILPLLVPYGIAGVLLVTLIVRSVDTGLGPDVLWLMAGVVAVGVLMAVRQIAAIRDLGVTVELERRALIASVSHELRTPLTAMMGFLELLEDPDLELQPEETREFLGMVGQQSRYLARIVGDLTMLARVGHEDVDLDRSTLEFETIVGRVQDSLEIDYVGFSVDAPAHLHLRVDGERIQQVLLNLVSNAIRYGGEDIEVVAIVRGTDVTIEVHDSGNGVPTRYQYTMWERFNRGAHHLNATVPGSGIGLAIVKLLSEAHGGRATYRRSERLGGACFAIELPNAVVAASAQPAPRTSLRSMESADVEDQVQAG